MLAIKTVIAVLPLVCALAVSADTSRPELRGIAKLNDCIQQRFMDVDKSFGFRRIIRPDDTPHRFRPENVCEMDAVQALEKAQLDVVLYLAGRRVLKPRTEGMERWAPKGPVRISSGNGGASGPPAGSALWDAARDALIAFGSNTSHAFNAPIGGWKMIARPIRASGAVCVECHAPLRVGDPIGVVLYAYR
jgi:hypothetical protein